MNQNTETGKSALVTPSGKQIMLQNDLERVFNAMNSDLVSPLHTRETPQDFRNSIFYTSPGDLDFKAFNSPMIYGLSFSPLKNTGVSFFEAFSRRFKNPKQLGADDLCPARPSSKFEGIFPDMLDPFEREPLPPNPSSLLKAPKASFKQESEQFGEAFESVPVQSTEPASKPQCDLLTQNPPEKALEQKPSISKFDADISKYGNRLINLKNLFFVLNKMYNHSPILVEEYSRLSKFEEELLNSMLQRKFLKRLRPRDFDLEVEKKVDLINEIINTKSHKRPEECYKFVLTRVIKHLKKHLKAGQVLVNDLEGYFYHHYFAETASLLGLPLSDFHYPLTGNKGQFKLNSKYFEKIFKSPSFLERLDIYLDGLLERDYRIEIAKKLDSLLQRWDDTILNSQSNLQGVENAINEYLLKNKRCKLPWTLNEVLESIDRFHNLLRNFRTSNLNKSH